MFPETVKLGKFHRRLWDGTVDHSWPMMGRHGPVQARWQYEGNSDVRTNVARRSATIGSTSGWKRVYSWNTMRYYANKRKPCHMSIRPIKPTHRPKWLAYCISYTILHRAEQIVSPEQVTATCLTYWSCRFRWDPCTPCKVASWKSSWKQNIPDARNKSIFNEFNAP